MLNVMAEVFADHVTFRCWGRLLAGKDAWTLYNSVISQPTSRVFVLDLSGIDRIDAGGLGVLVSVKQWATGEDIGLELIPSKRVHELLELTALDSQFEIVTSDKRMTARQRSGAEQIRIASSG
jgi:anti-anti-sigma regulatory factor